MMLYNYVSCHSLSQPEHRGDNSYNLRSVKGGHLFPWDEQAITEQDNSQVPKSIDRQTRLGQARDVIVTTRSRHFWSHSVLVMFKVRTSP